MSEFVEYPFEQSIGEVIGDAYDRVRTFVGDVLARAEILPIDIEQGESVGVELALAVQNDQQGQQGQNGQGQRPRPEHTCGASCSRCGKGGPQVVKPGLRR